MFIGPLSRVGSGFFVVFEIETDHRDRICGGKSGPRQVRTTETEDRRPTAAARSARGKTPRGRQRDSSKQRAEGADGAGGMHSFADVSAKWCMRAGNEEQRR